MPKMIREELIIDTEWSIEGMTANEFGAYVAGLVNRVPPEYRDAARVVNVGYDEPSYVLQWERPQTEQERIDEEREQREKAELNRQNIEKRERSEYERLKAKFGS